MPATRGGTDSDHVGVSRCDAQGLVYPGAFLGRQLAAGVFQGLGEGVLKQCLHQFLADSGRPAGGRQQIADDSPWWGIAEPETLSVAVVTDKGGFANDDWAARVRNEIE